MKILIWYCPCGDSIDLSGITEQLMINVVAAYKTGWSWDGSDLPKYCPECTTKRKSLRVAKTV